MKAAVSALIDGVPVKVCFLFDNDRAPIFVVMGVSGCGKSTVGQQLAAARGAARLHRSCGVGGIHPFVTACPQCDDPEKCAGLLQRRGQGVGHGIDQRENGMLSLNDKPGLGLELLSDLHKRADATVRVSAVD